MEVANKITSLVMLYLNKIFRFCVIDVARRRKVPKAIMLIKNVILEFVRSAWTKLETD